MFSSEPRMGTVGPVVVPPDDFVQKIAPPEDSVRHPSQQIIRCRVAMQIDAARGFENAAHLKQTHRHVYQIVFGRPA